MGFFFKFYFYCYSTSMLIIYNLFLYILTKTQCLFIKKKKRHTIVFTTVF